MPLRGIRFFRPPPRPGRAGAGAPRRPRRPRGGQPPGDIDVRQPPPPKRGARANQTTRRATAPAPLRGRGPSVLPYPTLPYPTRRAFEGGGGVPGQTLAAPVSRFLFPALLHSRRRGWGCLFRLVQLVHVNVAS
jgi:hypothetical protein